MASWREIDRLRKNARAFRALAKHLLDLSSDDATPWESDFLESIFLLADVKEFTTRQSEKMLQIRDDYELVATFRGFSVASLIRGCWEARLDLSEDDEAWIILLYEQRPGLIKRRSIGRLMRCARQIGLIDDQVAA